MANTFTLEGTLKDGKNNPLVGKYVRFRITAAGTDVEDNVTYPRETFDVGPTDSNGDLPSTSLWINGDSGVQCYYEIRMPDGEKINVIIPSTAEGTTRRLEDILETDRATGSNQQESTTLQAANAYTDVLAADPSNNTSFSATAWRTDLNVEDGATADQTGAEIKTLYEAEADTNAFSDSDKSRLDGIINSNGAGQVGSSCSSSLGFSGGILCTETGSGSATGFNSSASNGCAAGNAASTTDGGAIGSGATSTDGFAGGSNALANGTGRVQLGSGTNSTDNSIQFLSSGSVTAPQFGRLAKSTTSVTTTSYTVLSTDHVLLVDDDTAGSAVTITLPSAATVGDGWVVTIKKKGSTANITIDPDGSETIDGDTTILLQHTNQAMSIVSDGSNWCRMYPTTPKGWAYYKDAQYTTSSRLTLTGTPTRDLLTIDGLDTSTNTNFLPDGVSAFWDTTNDKILAQRDGDSFDVKVEFNVDVPSNTDSIKLELDVGSGSPDVISTHTFQFAQSGEQIAMVSFPAFTLSTFLANGGKIYLTASTTGVEIWGASIFIKRDFSPL